MSQLDSKALKTLHRASMRNRALLEKSKLCGCFCCLRTFPPSKIKRWVDSGTTAICPHCGIDAVLGDEQTPLNPELLRQMYNAYFSAWKKPDGTVVHENPDGTVVYEEKKGPS